MSTIEMTAPATGATWFNLHRHDGEEGDTAPEPAEGDTDAGDDDAQQMLDDALDDNTDDEGDDSDDGDGQPEDDKGLGEAGQKALARMKAERAAARREAAAAKKQLADLTKRVQDFEDRDKSDLEKATGKVERAEKQAARAVARAVSAEVKVAAAGQFADPTDAVDVLMRDPAKYVDSDGEIDTDAIEADLADLLERKPHWGRPEPAPAAPAEPPARQQKQKPKPDPGQGSRGGPAKTDYLTADKDAVAEYLSQFGYRQRA